MCIFTRNFAEPDFQRSKSTQLRRLGAARWMWTHLTTTPWWACTPTGGPSTCSADSAGTAWHRWSEPPTTIGTDTSSLYLINRPINVIIFWRPRFRFLQRVTIRPETWIPDRPTHFRLDIVSCRNWPFIRAEPESLRNFDPPEVNFRFKPEVTRNSRLTAYSTRIFGP